MASELACSPLIRFSLAGTWIISRVFAGFFFFFCDCELKLLDWHSKSDCEFKENSLFCFSGLFGTIKVIFWVILIKKKT